MDHAKLVPSHSRGPEQDEMSYRAGFSGTPVAIITPTRSGAVAAPALYDFPHHRLHVFESIRLVSHATRVSSHALASVVLRAQEAGPPGSRVH